MDAIEQDNRRCERPITYTKTGWPVHTARRILTWTHSECCRQPGTFRGGKRCTQKHSGIRAQGRQGQRGKVRFMPHHGVSVARLPNATSAVSGKKATHRSRHPEACDSPTHDASSISLCNHKDMTTHDGMEWRKRNDASGTKSGKEPTSTSFRAHAHAPTHSV